MQGFTQLASSRLVYDNSLLTLHKSLILISSRTISTQSAIFTTTTQPNITKVGFDKKMTLHHHHHHRKLNVIDISAVTKPILTKLLENFCWTKLLLTRIFFGPKNLIDQKYFCSTFFRARFCYPKIFVPNFFENQHFFYLTYYKP